MLVYLRDGSTWLEDLGGGSTWLEDLGGWSTWLEDLGGGVIQNLLKGRLLSADCKLTTFICLGRRADMVANVYV